MSFLVKRIDYDIDHEAYLTDNDEYGSLEEAKEFDDYGDAFDATIDPPWDETGEYDYEIEEKQ